MLSHLFVYGTLRSDCGNARGELLRRHFTRLGLGRVRGDLYDLGGYPGLHEEASAWVIGEVYRLHGPPDVFTALDDYEECGSGFPLPHEYQRRTLPVCHMGRTIAAQVYCYRGPLDPLRRIRSGDYRLHLGAGSDACAGEFPARHDVQRASISSSTS